MSRFNFINTQLSGVKLVERSLIEDDRGFFSRFYCVQEFSDVGLDKPIVQINHTLTRKKGAVRGLHFQHPPYAETKLVSCVKGEVWDVAVDIRQGSPTFLKWHGEILSEQNHHSLLIPEGFAHGFQALTNDCELIYLHTESYRAEAEGGLNVEDPMLDIEWPCSIEELSDRDRGHEFLKENYQGLVL